jgi:putative PIN family toxin of toxin-antitoxin system
VAPRITPDSNILISAFVFGGNPLRLIEMALNGEVDMFVSDAIVDETLRVLRDKFGLSTRRLAEAEKYIINCTQRVKPAKTLNVVKEDADDNRVLECAEAAGCQAIVTGDLDLLRLREYEGIRITTVREFLDRAEESSG